MHHNGSVPGLESTRTLTTHDHVAHVHTDNTGQHNKEQAKCKPRGSSLSRTLEVLRLRHGA